MCVCASDGSVKAEIPASAAPVRALEQPMRMDGEVQDARIRAVLAIIERQPNSSVRELAGSVGLSARRLESLFRNETGAHIRHFIIEQRLRTAAHLLSTSDLSIKEIAYLIGYGHPSSFTRAFERRFVQSPKSFRQRAAAQNAK